MSARFEELDWRETSIGVVSLRRRWDASLNVDVYEVKLDDEFLMSSLFTVAEVEIARLGLAAVPDDDLDVVVGGLGLGFTARAALADQRVRSLHAVEALDAVIEWHQQQLLPMAAGLTSDPRTRLVHGDFYAMASGSLDVDSQRPDRRFHAILLDIDHSPTHLLDSGHAAFYTPEGLARLAENLHPNGVFALWSDDPPDPDFNEVLRTVFTTSEAHLVKFDTPYTNVEAANTVYVAKRD